jgi:hypothetical protein
MNKTAGVAVAPREVSLALNLRLHFGGIVSWPLSYLGGEMTKIHVTDYIQQGRFSVAIKHNRHQYLIFDGSTYHLTWEDLD